MKSRRGFAIQRLMNAMLQAHADGWFIVFDTVTLADDRLEAFYDNPNALRDYFRDIGRMVLAAEGRKANDSQADAYQFFFFSSRRRHTRCSRDWSSDVCSSDLSSLRPAVFCTGAAFPRCRDRFAGARGASLRGPAPAPRRRGCLVQRRRRGIQIGRASCRERGGISEGGGGVK